MLRIVGMHSQPRTDGVACRDSCGKTLPSEDAALQAGWSYLAVSRLWRCGACEGALMSVNAKKDQNAAGTAQVRNPSDL
jgi:hypothetical protein